MIWELWREPSKLERITPLIFYHNHLPDMIEGYLFSFKTNGDARLSCSIYKNSDSEPIFSQYIIRQRGGRPFTVRWHCRDDSEGLYKLIVSGYFLDSNDPIDQIVLFYHNPQLK